jgi:membrane protein DedA with SNARE-associated domain
MLGSLARHSFWAIVLAIMVEELGIPMPIPTDVLIVLTGTQAGWSIPQLGLSFVMIALASTIGASCLYTIIRRGGRPLVERYGRYVHMGPKQLARSEALLARGGWKAIAIGRATPGLRYAVVVACGLFKVPYLRFVTAHLAGSSVYIAVFLVLGAAFGPAILDLIHLPELGIRILWLLLLAVGLPLLMMWWGSHAHPRQPRHPSRRREVGAVLLGSFAGTVALAAAWSITANVAYLLGVNHPLNVTYALLSRLLSLSLGLSIGGISLLSYAALLLLFMSIGAAYYELVLPHLAPHGVSLFRQMLSLALLAFGLFATIFVSAPLVMRNESFGLWWQTGGPVVLLGIALGLIGYALTTVYGRALAIAVAPSLRRNVS